MSHLTVDWKERAHCLPPSPGTAFWIARIFETKAKNIFNHWRVVVKIQCIMYVKCLEKCLALTKHKEIPLSSIKLNPEPLRKQHQVENLPGKVSEVSPWLKALDLVPQLHLPIEVFFLFFLLLSLPTLALSILFLLPPWYWSHVGWNLFPCRVRNYIQGI